MIKYLKHIKSQVLRFYYIRLPFLSPNIKKKSYYKFVEDGYNDLLYNELFLNDESIVFDVGAFKGEFTNSILKLCNCNIYIFEPVKEYYKIIKEKYKDNPKTHCYNFGLGKYGLDTDINKTGSSSSIYFHSDIQKQTEKIRIDSITEFITNNKIENIDLIKINIEGGEYDLLDSLISSQHIIKSINTLLIQFHDFIPNALDRRKNIQDKLSDSHIKVFDYPFIWEKWVKNKNHFI